MEGADPAKTAAGTVTVKTESGHGAKSEVGGLGFRVLLSLRWALWGRMEKKMEATTGFRVRGLG